MEGNFIRKKTDIWLILSLLGCAFIVAVAISLSRSGVDSGLLAPLFAIGLLYSFIAISLIILNHKKYLYIDETSIHAKYGFFAKLDCNIDEVEFALAQINALTILLKNGKRHMIMGISNPWELCFAIRTKTFALETQSPDALFQELNQVKSTRKKELWYAIGGIMLMFVVIFVTVLLTGFRDLNEFNTLDWVIFALMGVIELLILVGSFYIADRCGKKLLLIIQLTHRINGAIIASSPMPNNCVKSVYTDANYTGRVIVCGYPNDESVYFCIQEFTDSFVLETTYTSEICNSENELPDDLFSSLIDISSAVLSE